MIKLEHEIIESDNLGEYIANYNKTLSSLHEVREEISSLIEQSRTELLLFASKKLLNAIITKYSILN